MKIGTIILCRYSSSRLPGKILRDIEGKTPLQYLYEKFTKYIPEEELLVATSTDSSDDIIEEFCVTHGYNCFRGSLDNVSLRFLEAAQSRDFDYAIRINGDALFLDIPTYLEMIERCRAGDYDFVSNVRGRSFPFGMSVEIVKTDFYRALQEKIQADSRYVEHVTLYLYEHPREGKQYHHLNTVCPELSGLQIALDEAQDLALAKRVMIKLKDDYYHCDLQQFRQVIETIRSEYQLEGKEWPFYKNV
jgi:spore coat polysaccharide biosynthesis protein SpsF